MAVGLGQVAALAEVPGGGSGISRISVIRADVAVGARSVDSDHTDVDKGGENGVPHSHDVGRELAEQHKEGED